MRTIIYNISEHSKNTVTFDWLVIWQIDSWVIFIFIFY